MSVSISDETFAEELDYRPQAASYPRYRYARVAPISGVNNPVLSVSGGEYQEFLIPAVVHNLAKTKLRFDITLAAGGAGVHSAIFKDCMPMIQSMSLRTQSGIQLAQCNYVHKFTKLMWRAQKKESLNTNDKGNGFVSAGILIDKALVEGPRASGSDINAGSLTSTVRLLARYPATLSEDTATPANVLVSTVGVSTAMDIQTIEVSSANTAMTLSYLVPLSLIAPHSLMASNRDLFFNEPLVLNIVWNGTNRIYTLPLTADVVGNVDAITATPGNGGPPVSWGTPAVTVQMANLELHLAREDNPEIAAMVINAVRSPAGLSFLADSYMVGKTTINGSTSHTASMRLGGDGSLLRAVYTAPFFTTETGPLAYDNGNENGFKTNVVYTTLDSNRLQDNQLNISATQFDDWIYMREQLKGTAYTSLNQYRRNFFLVDNFAGNSLAELQHAANKVSGIPVGSGRDYQIVASTAVAKTLNWYIFAVFQKKFTIDSQGVRYV
jgi:hypothetical protein